MRKIKSPLQRMMTRVKLPIDKDGTVNTKKCWLWIGPKNNAGYGMMRSGGDSAKMATVHRVSYIETYQNIDYTDKVEILHKCGNKLCVNPQHLMCGDMNDRHDLQRKYKAYNKNFHNKEYMNPVCEYCGTSTYLPWFKIKHKDCINNNTYSCSKV